MVSKYGTNTTKLPTIPVRNPATARKKYTPATVVMNRLTVTSSFWFTSPQYSQMLRPVIRANRNTIALGFRKQDTIHTTKSTPVMDLITRFFCFSVMVLLFIRYFSRFQKLSRNPSQKHHLKFFRKPSLLYPQKPLQELSQKYSLLPPPSKLSEPLRAP